MEKEGTAVISVGGIYKEASQLQTLDWYENGCRYELYCDFMNVTIEEMTEFAEYYFENAQ